MCSAKLQWGTKAGATPHLGTSPTYFTTAPCAHSRKLFWSASHFPWSFIFTFKHASSAWSFPAHKPWIFWKTGTAVLMQRLRFFCSSTQSASDGGLDIHWWKAMNCCGQLRAISSIISWSSAADMAGMNAVESRGSLVPENRLQNSVPDDGTHTRWSWSIRLRADIGVSPSIAVSTACLLARLLLLGYCCSAFLEGVADFVRRSGDGDFTCGAHFRIPSPVYIFPGDDGLASWLSCSPNLNLTLAHLLRYRLPPSHFPFFHFSFCDFLTFFCDVLTFFCDFLTFRLALSHVLTRTFSLSRSQFSRSTCQPQLLRSTQPLLHDTSSPNCPRHLDLVSGCLRGS